MTPDDYRSAMRRVPTGVTVVTTMSDGQPKGFTANAFSSVSANPPTVLICVNRNARSHPVISAAGRFCVNVLRYEQQPIAERFATKEPSDPFISIGYSADVTGAPVIDNVFAYFDCKVAEEHSAGTHTVFLGTVVACGSSSGVPLGYFNGAYLDFGCLVR